MSSMISVGEGLGCSEKMQVAKSVRGHSEANSLVLQPGGGRRMGG